MSRHSVAVAQGVVAQGWWWSVTPFDWRTNCVRTRASTVMLLMASLFVRLEKRITSYLLSSPFVRDNLAVELKKRSNELGKGLAGAFPVGHVP
jgi:hypothetical protein